MEQRVSMVTLGVVDLDRSRRFYEDGLGWKRANKDDGIVFFQLPGAVLGLWSAASLAEEVGLGEAATGFGGIALAYNARSREAVDEVLAQAEAAGARVLKPASETVWGGYSGYFCDPDSHPWEVAFNPFWSIDEAGMVTLSP